LPLEDKHNIGCALGVKVLRPIGLRHSGARYAYGPFVAFQFVDA
jgi:hypothetical protein